MPASSEFANLFPITVRDETGGQVDLSTSERRNEYIQALEESLKSQGWFIHGQRFGRLTAHPRGASISVPESVSQIARLFRAYSFQFRHYWGRLYLCVDYSLEVRNVLSVHALTSVFPAADLINRSALAQWNGWRRGKIVSADPEWTHVRLYEFESEERLPSSKVIPSLPTFMIERVLAHRNVSYDLHRAIKEGSLSLDPNAPRIRAEKTRAIVAEIERTIFPLTVGAVSVSLGTDAVALQRPRNGQQGFIGRTLNEPSVEFNNHRETPDISGQHYEVRIVQQHTEDNRSRSDVHARDA